MRKTERAAQARRELDRKFEAAHLEPIVARPRSGWIRAIRGSLGMSQAALAARLSISGPAVNKLEHAELTGGITTAKLAEVATALNCSLVYALVPNTTIEETIQAEALRAAASTLGYAGRTMALEAQGIDHDRQREAWERFAQDLIARGDLWRPSPLARRPPVSTP
ncbi:MAG: mobile mystery protein A [Candidatus Dormibacteria bacterium]